MKKQILSALTLAIIAINLTACNGNKSESSDNKETNPDTKPAEQTNNSLSSIFPKHTSVFGISIYGTAATPDDSLKHAANIMAEYLDNDEDGLPNNQQVVDHMVAKGASLIIAATENEMEALYDKLPETGAFQDLYVSEVAPNGASQGTFDASLEEVLHLITHEGYAGVYPSTFGEAAGSVIADAMDMARGGQFTTIPNTYPANAWYTYDDATCTYDCMVTEYTYWALTSILGAQDFAGRFEQISHEWKLNTKEKVQSQDLAVYSLLTDPQYGLASTLPDGQYTPMNFEITHTEVDNTDTTDNNSGSGEQLATFTFENNDSDSETVYMNGVINSNTLSDITALFSQNPQITTLVMQNVPGSMDDEINLLASREIRKRGIATHIPADGIVASGGTDMFLAGSKRTIEPGAQLGVHSWAGGGQEATDFPRDHQEHVKYLDYYQEMAIDTEFYWYTIEAATADDIHWMTEEEIEQYGILTE